MKKDNSKQKFLEKLREGNNVSTACKLSGFSRQTIYRWRNANTSFKVEMDAALENGYEFMDDFAENQLKKAIQDGNLKAAIYWLSNRHSKFKKKDPPLLPENIYPKIEKTEIQKPEPEKKQLFDMESLQLSTQKTLRERRIQKEQIELEKIKKKIEEEELTKDHSGMSHYFKDQSSLL